MLLKERFNCARQSPLIRAEKLEQSPKLVNSMPGIRASSSVTHHRVLRLHPLQMEQGSFRRAMTKEINFG